MKKTLTLLSACCIIHTLVHAQTDWHITGNSGTNATNNFIGTTDNVPLSLRTNNLLRMRITGTGNIGIGTSGPLQKLDVNGNINIRNGFGLYIDNHRVLRVDSANGNIFLGNGTGAAITTGFYNTATGYQALLLNTTGSYNSAHGTRALASNLNGSINTASGVYALFSNNSGGANTANGYAALYRNTSGSNNTAMGSYVLFSNTTASYNTAGGNYSMYYNTTGYSNTSHGYASLYYNTGGYENVANGYAALYNNTTGYWNTAIGKDALYQNTSGNSNTAVGLAALYNNSTGYGNTATGNIALTTNTTGVYNSAFGIGALTLNSGGSFNTAVGTDALYGNTTSYYNCALGYLALAYANPGYNNTAVGSFTGPAPDFDGLYNTIAVGNSTFVTASNQARFGNSSTTSIGGYANWTNISDGRVKKNMKANVPGLAFINKLKPITYNLDLDAADRITRSAAKKDKAGKMIAPSQEDINARNAKQQVVYTGFVAQEVEEAAKELNYDFSGVDAARNDRDLYGLRYAEFVVPLVKAVQELSQKVEKLEAALAEKNSAIASTTSSENIVVADASLGQNTPNPFRGSTSISYTLPQKFSSAQLIINDQNGRVVKQVNISGTGKGVVNINATTLSSGNYHYSLVVDGNLVGTKQMILAK